jgi:hypothetical protein
MSIVEQIESVLLTRPQYNDTNLGNEGLWKLDNAPALARYWQQLGRALGVDDPEGEEDIDLFCSEQHRQQMREHPGFMYERAS